MPEDVFVSWQLAVVLLVLTIAGWLYLFLRKAPSASGRKLSTDYIVYILFISNFVGVIFARTLHYQFYVWYFHQLPWLLWVATALPIPVKIGVMVAVEVAFNVYPATPHSSLLLQLAHLVLFGGLLSSKAPSPIEIEQNEEKDTKKSR